MIDEGGKLACLQPLMKGSPNPAAVKLDLTGQEEGISCVVVCDWLVDIL
jgi:hypothetical protein